MFVAQKQSRPNSAQSLVADAQPTIVSAVSRPTVSTSPARSVPQSTPPKTHLPPFNRESPKSQCQCSLILDNTINTSYRYYRSKLRGFCVGDICSMGIPAIIPLSDRTGFVGHCRVRSFSSVLDFVPRFMGTVPDVTDHCLGHVCDAPKKAAKAASVSILYTLNDIVRIEVVNLTKTLLPSGTS